VSYRRRREGRGHRRGVSRIHRIKLKRRADLLELRLGGRERLCATRHGRNLEALSRELDCRATAHSRAAADDRAYAFEFWKAEEEGCYGRGAAAVPGYTYNLLT
jgi:hypothetical protein